LSHRAGRRRERAGGNWREKHRQTRRGVRPRSGTKHPDGSRHRHRLQFEVAVGPEEQATRRSRVAADRAHARHRAAAQIQRKETLGTEDVRIEDRRVLAGDRDIDRRETYQEQRQRHGAARDRAGQDDFIVLETGIRREAVVRRRVEVQRRGAADDGGGVAERAGGGHDFLELGKDRQLVAGVARAGAGHHEAGAGLRDTVQLVRSHVGLEITFELVADNGGRDRAEIAGVRVDHGGAEGEVIDVERGHAAFIGTGSRCVEIVGGDRGGGAWCAHRQQ
jgi:hypothetical protein